MLTRRQWVVAGLAALPALAGTRIDRSRISVITDEVGRTPAEAIAFARHYGLQWVELRDVPGSRAGYALLPEPELRSAARELADHGLRVSFLNTPLLKFSLPGTERAQRRPESDEERARRIVADQARFDGRMEALRKALAAAHILGVDKVRVFTFSRVAEPATLLPRVAEILLEMAQVAGKQEVQLLVENEGSCNVATCAELAALMRLLPSRWIGINWDPLNVTGQKETPFPDGYRLLPKERIGNVQIKGRSVLEGPQRLDWASIFRALEQDGYRGCAGLETHIFGEVQIEASHTSMQEILRIVEGS